MDRNTLLLSRKFFDEDNYTPMTCQDEKECNSVLEQFPYDSSTLAQVLRLRVVSC